jgi:hypothetical protein
MLRLTPFITGECAKSMHRVYMATSRLQSARSKACVAIELHQKTAMKSIR